VVQLHIPSPATAILAASVTAAVGLLQDG
jgi:hypothetical protein